MAAHRKPGSSSVPSAAESIQRSERAAGSRGRLLDGTPKVQVFATDIDGEALQLGRDGLYGPAIAEQVSPQRLERFFIKHSAGGAGGYQVTKDLRNMCLFSVHNLIKDPPFSRVDLISCRNVLIYMNSELQRKLMQIFHYALRPGGYLFLGPSESVSGHGDLFEPVEKSAGIYRRKDAVFPPPHWAAGHDAQTQHTRAAIGGSQFLLEKMPEHKRHGGVNAGHPTPVDIARSVDRMLLSHYGPPCVVVNRRHEAVYFGGNTGRYLQPPQGHPSHDVLEMARRGLKTELRSVLQEAFKTHKRVERLGVSVQTNGSVEMVDVVAQPLSMTDEEPELFIVVFQPPAPTPIHTQAAHAAQDSRSAAAAKLASKKQEARDRAQRKRDEKSQVRHLENELTATRQHLQSTIEELESSNEELKSMNEELLSMNEKLQSANEEVETSREELQSVNEELETVNAELAGKVKELARANDDLKNLFASTQIATVFLDNNLRIKSFTPAATDIFRLIDGDVGRPLTDIASRFALGDLHDEVRKVLRTLSPLERQVKVAGGGSADLWHLMRILPYRTHENVISGVVLTFVDLTPVKRAEETQARLAAIVESSADAIVGADMRDRINAWNASAQRMFGYSPSEILGRPMTTLIPPERHDEERELLARIERGEHIEQMETERLAKDGRRIEVSLSASPIRAEDGTVSGKSSILRDISERKEHERHQKMLVDELDHRVKNTLAVVSALCSQSAEGAGSVEEFRRTFEGRIRAMAAAHKQLSRAQWRGAELRSLVEDTVAPHTSRDRCNVSIEGPKVVLTSKGALAFALVLHELSTNAAKYGPLSDTADARACQLNVTWNVDCVNGLDRLHVNWSEHRSTPLEQGPKPEKEGFGTTLIQRNVQYELNGSFKREITPYGCSATIDVPLTSEIGSTDRH